MGRSWAGKMGRSVAGLGAMEVWAWVVKIEKRKRRCNEKKKGGEIITIII